MNLELTKLKSNYVVGSDLLQPWHQDVLSGQGPVLYPLGGALLPVEVGPGLVTLLGGAPGAGKTAFVMQAVVEALRATPDLRALVCNIEMPPAVLLDRQLARLSGVDATTIRKRKIPPEHAERITLGINTLKAIADRLAFVRPPFTLDNVGATADAFAAKLLVLDYIQRIPPRGKHDSRRSAIDASMDLLRQFADAGCAVVVVSAVARTKDDKGRSSYGGKGLNLASFRESSELEFGADDAFILHPAGDDAEGDLVTLKHLKSRYGECRDVQMHFDAARQSFTPVDRVPEKASTGKDKVRASLKALWNETPAAGGDNV